MFVPDGLLYLASMFVAFLFLVIRMLWVSLAEVNDRLDRLADHSNSFDPRTGGHCEGCVCFYAPHNVEMRERVESVYFRPDPLPYPEAPLPPVKWRPISDAYDAARDTRLEA